MPRLDWKLVLNLSNLGHVDLSIIVIISLDSVYHHFLKTHTSIIQARCSQDFCLKTITNGENVCARGAVWGSGQIGNFGNSSYGGKVEGGEETGTCRLGLT